MRVFTRFLFLVLVTNLNLPAFENKTKQKNTQLMTVSLETVRMAKSSDLPQDYLAI